MMDPHVEESPAASPPAPPTGPIPPTRRGVHYNSMRRFFVSAVTISVTVFLAIFLSIIVTQKCCNQMYKEQIHDPETLKNVNTVVFSLDVKGRDRTVGGESYWQYGFRLLPKRARFSSFGAFQAILSIPITTHMEFVDANGNEIRKPKNEENKIFKIPCVVSTEYQEGATMVGNFTVLSCNEVTLAQKTGHMMSNIVLSLVADQFQGIVHHITQLRPVLGRILCIARIALTLLSVALLAILLIYILPRKAMAVFGNLQTICVLVTGCFVGNNPVWAVGYFIEQFIGEIHQSWYIKLDDYCIGAGVGALLLYCLDGMRSEYAALYELVREEEERQGINEVERARPKDLTASPVYYRIFWRLSQITRSMIAAAMVGVGLAQAQGQYGNVSHLTTFLLQVGAIVAAVIYISRWYRYRSLRSVVMVSNTTLHSPLITMHLQRSVDSMWLRFMLHAVFAYVCTIAIAVSLGMRFGPASGNYIAMYAVITATAFVGVVTTFDFFSQELIPESPIDDGQKCMWFILLCALTCQLGDAPVLQTVDDWRSNQANPKKTMVRHRKSIMLVTLLIVIFGCTVAYVASTGSPVNVLGSTLFATGKQKEGFTNPEEQCNATSNALKLRLPNVLPFDLKERDDWGIHVTPVGFRPPWDTVAPADVYYVQLSYTLGLSSRLSEKPRLRATETIKCTTLSSDVPNPSVGQGLGAPWVGPRESNATNTSNSLQGLSWTCSSMSFNSIPQQLSELTLQIACNNSAQAYDSEYAPFAIIDGSALLFEGFLVEYWESNVEGFLNEIQGVGATILVLTTIFLLYSMITTPTLESDQFLAVPGFSLSLTGASLVGTLLLLDPIYIMVSTKNDAIERVPTIIGSMIMCMVVHTTLLRACVAVTSGSLEPVGSLRARQLHKVYKGTMKASIPLMVTLSVSFFTSIFGKMPAFFSFLMNFIYGFHVTMLLVGLIGTWMKHSAPSTEPSHRPELYREPPMFMCEARRVFWVWRRIWWLWPIGMAVIFQSMKMRRFLFHTMDIESRLMQRRQLAFHITFCIAWTFAVAWLTMPHQSVMRLLSLPRRFFRRKARTAAHRVESRDQEIIDDVVGSQRNSTIAPRWLSASLNSRIIVVTIAMAVVLLSVPFSIGFAYPIMSRAALAPENYQQRTVEHGTIVEFSIDLRGRGANMLMSNWQVYLHATLGPDYEAYAGGYVTQAHYTAVLRSRRFGKKVTNFGVTPIEAKRTLDAQFIFSGRGPYRGETLDIQITVENPKDKDGKDVPIFVQQAIYRVPRAGFLKLIVISRIILLALSVVLGVYHLGNRYWTRRRLGRGSQAHSVEGIHKVSRLGILAIIGCCLVNNPYVVMNYWGDESVSYSLCMADTAFMSLGIGLILFVIAEGASLWAVGGFTTNPKRRLTQANMFGVLRTGLHLLICGVLATSFAYVVWAEQRGKGSVFHLPYTNNMYIEVLDVLLVAAALYVGGLILWPLMLVFPKLRVYVQAHAAAASKPGAFKEGLPMIILTGVLTVSILCAILASTHGWFSPPVDYMTLPLMVLVFVWAAVVSWFSACVDCGTTSSYVALATDDIFGDVDGVDNLLIGDLSDDDEPAVREEQSEEMSARFTTPAAAAAAAEAVENPPERSRPPSPLPARPVVQYEL